eukprot:TRINITY_DN47_c0_g1_i2.p1 TRINITY_DN47_c0_g1~~TRINITY_DN47_c0_g1_i2.p1  ORF type:complete len:299 (+),score=97.14 TRINITY_DN47_c0_g1_i2:233-1129(+)
MLRLLKPKKLVKPGIPERQETQTSETKETRETKDTRPTETRDTKPTEDVKTSNSKETRDTKDTRETKPTQDVKTSETKETRETRETKSNGDVKTSEIKESTSRSRIVGSFTKIDPPHPTENPSFSLVTERPPVRTFVAVKKELEISLGGDVTEEQFKNGISSALNIDSNQVIVKGIEKFEDGTGKRKVVSVISFEIVGKDGKSLDDQPASTVTTDEKFTSSSSVIEALNTLIKENPQVFEQSGLPTPVAQLTVSESTYVAEESYSVYATHNTANVVASSSGRVVSSFALFLISFAVLF